MSTAVWAMISCAIIAILVQKSVGNDILKMPLVVYSFEGDMDIVGQSSEFVEFELLECK